MKTSIFNATGNSKLEMILPLLLLLLACCYYSEGESLRGCKCGERECLHPIGGSYESDYYSPHYRCPYYNTNLSHWDNCSCLAKVYLERPDTYCQCDNITKTCVIDNPYCYYPTSCVPCAGLQCTWPRDSCNWYTDCLDWQFPECTGDENYALSYGLVYCDKYKENMYLLSDVGKEWIKNVNYCLQRAIAPQFSVDPPPSCSEIKAAAFASHEPCYTKPEGYNFICQLSCTDILAIMWTVKGAFLQEFKQSVHQSLGVTGTCVTSETSLGFKICVAKDDAAGAGASPQTFGIYRIIQVATTLASRLKRSVDCYETCLAEGLAKSIFDKMNLPEDNSIEWFAFPETSGDTLEVTVLLSDLSFLNASTSISTSDDPYAALDSTAEKFRSVALSQREVTVNAQVLEINLVSTCGDLECVEKSSTKVSHDMGDGVMLRAGSIIPVCMFLIISVVL